MNDEAAGDGAQAEQGSVFGKLPASRPGTRSPRRDSATKAKAKPAATKAKAASAKRKPAAAPRPRPADKPRPAAPEPDERSQPEGGGGLDDLAWAGVAAVAEAATLGVRLVNRALGTVRDSVDRR